MTALVVLVLLLILVACTASTDELSDAAQQTVTEDKAEEITPDPVDAQESAAEPALAEAEPVTLRIGSLYIWDTVNPTFGWYGYNNGGGLGRTEQL